MGPRLTELESIASNGVIQPFMSHLLWPASHFRICRIGNSDLNLSRVLISVSILKDITETLDTFEPWAAV